MSTERYVGEVFGVPIDALSWEAVTRRILDWAGRKESRYVAICNAHVVVTASRDPVYRRLIAEADMATPDGAPVAWMLRRMGFAGQPRISGPDLMWRLCERCAGEGISIYLYGSTPTTLRALEGRLRSALPGLAIGGLESPPFRSYAEQIEDEGAIERINRSGAGIVFVGLGCPKQERWIAEHRGRVQAVMIGVGAAFDFHAGTIARAPEWMRNNGLEWLHRLASEPRRLWKRYLVTNSLFLYLAAVQLVKRLFQAVL